jgi:hypothetical protein
MAIKPPEKTEDLTEESVYTPSTDEIVAALAAPESLESRLMNLIGRLESAIEKIEKKPEAK